MNAKGVAFLARKKLVTDEKGEPVWEAYLAELARQEPFFKQHVLPVTQIPVTMFLRSLDLLVAKVYAREPTTWWHFGKSAGKQAVTTGQLKGLFKPGEGRKVLQFAPKIWSSYFDFGALTSREVGTDAMELVITGAPPHPYFEGAVIGFASGAIELLGAKKPVPDRIKGFATGDKEVVYRFKSI